MPLESKLAKPGELLEALAKHECLKRNYKLRSKICELGPAKDYT